MDIRKTTYLGTFFSVALLSFSIAQAKGPNHPPPDAVNTLGQLQCVAGEVALFNGADWVCSDITARLDALEAENRALKDRLACVDSASDASQFVFEGCNVHVRNGAGQTDSINGAGNLVVGYDEARPVGSDKTGSHNMVIGDWHNYSSYGGLVAGFSNTISAKWASVSGGVLNTASGAESSVSGGLGNTANGQLSSVSGGTHNTASGAESSVSGGVLNTASGSQASVSGGIRNTASGEEASVSGGVDNTASGPQASVSGGIRNTAGGIESSVSGGEGCITSFPYSWGVGDTDDSTIGCVTNNLP